MCYSPISQLQNQLYDTVTGQNLKYSFYSQGLYGLSGPIIFLFLHIFELVTKVFQWFICFNSSTLAKGQFRDETFVQISYGHVNSVITHTRTNMHSSKF